MDTMNDTTPYRSTSPSPTLKPICPIPKPQSSTGKVKCYRNTPFKIVTKGFRASKKSRVSMEKPTHNEDQTNTKEPRPTREQAHTADPEQTANPIKAQTPIIS